MTREWPAAPIVCGSSMNGPHRPRSLPPASCGDLRAILIGLERRDELIDGVLEVVPHRFEVDAESSIRVGLPVLLPVTVAHRDPLERCSVFQEADAPVCPEEVGVGVGVTTVRKVGRQKLDPAPALAVLALIQLCRAMNPNDEQQMLVERLVAILGAKRNLGAQTMQSDAGSASSSSLFMT